LGWGTGIGGRSSVSLASIGELPDESNHDSAAGSTAGPKAEARAAGDGEAGALDDVEKICPKPRHAGYAVASGLGFDAYEHRDRRVKGRPEAERGRGAKRRPTAALEAPGSWCHPQ
jgi:hypothetical protein